MQRQAEAKVWLCPRSLLALTATFPAWKQLARQLPHVLPGGDSLLASAYCFLVGRVGRVTFLLLLLLLLVFSDTGMSLYAMCKTQGRYRSGVTVSSVREEPTGSWLTLVLSTCRGALVMADVAFHGFHAVACRVSCLCVATDTRRR